MLKCHVGRASGATRELIRLARTAARDLSTALRSQRSIMLKQVLERNPAIDPATAH
jgi:hypothetical protein